MVEAALTRLGVDHEPADRGEGFVGPALPGLRPYRAARVGQDEIRTWTDGRAWVKVRSTTAWTGSRLFGDLGAVVRPIRVGSGVAYVAEDCTRVGIHGDELDVVVTGSVAPAELQRIAGSLGVVGRPVPDGWAEASTVTLAGARRAVPGLLEVPAGAGFSTPGARADGRSVVLVYAGPGDRGLVLASRAADSLTPPLDTDAVGVVVRDRVARWSPRRGELEWVEAGRLWSLRSSTVGLVELVQLADSLAAR